jgi:hypothetical protein
MGLKAFDENITIALTDPHGAALYNFFAHGELKAEGNSVAEGIGQARITANLDGAPIDTQFRMSDAEGLEWVGRLLAEEGLALGLSSGINVAGAVALGRHLVAQGRKDVRVATILCDTGFRYLSTLYNRVWLESKSLPVFPGWRNGVNRIMNVGSRTISETSAPQHLLAPTRANCAPRRYSVCRSGCSAGLDAAAGRAGQHHHGSCPRQ